MQQQRRMQKLSLSGLKCQSVLVTRLSWNPSPGQSQHSNELIAAGHLKCLISVRTMKTSLSAWLKVDRQSILCSTILPLASSGWYQLALSSLGPLFWAVPSINLTIFKRKILGNSENQTRGCWVRSKYATTVLCSPLRHGPFLEQLLRRVSWIMW